jgi:uncharacterized membrane protein YsdA (DUF1294 family)
LAGAAAARANTHKTTQTPFRLSCGVPGKTRWVATSIARFDPDVDWPTDLDCSFVWNAGLRAYDGTERSSREIFLLRARRRLGGIMGVFLGGERVRHATH